MKADINDVDPAYLKCPALTQHESYFVLKIFFGFDEYIWKTFAYQSQSFKYETFNEKTDFFINWLSNQTSGAQDPWLQSYNQEVELVELPPFKELTVTIEMSIWIASSQSIELNIHYCSGYTVDHWGTCVRLLPRIIRCATSIPQDFYPHLKCSESQRLSYSFESIFGNSSDTSSNVSLSFPFQFCGGNGAFVEANLLIVRTGMPASVSGSSYHKGDSLTSGYIGVIVFAVLELFAIVVLVGWMFRKRLGCKRVGSVDQNFNDVSMVEEEQTEVTL